MCTPISAFARVQTFLSIFLLPQQIRLSSLQSQPLTLLIFLHPQQLMLIVWHP